MIKFCKIIFVLFWMALIFSFSMDNGDSSTVKSNTIIDIVSKFFYREELTLEEKEGVHEKYEIIVRKTAHFTLYFFLGFSVLLLLKEYNLINKRGIIISICFVLLYACSDEVHQLFVPDRSGEILDVLLDTIGGSLGVYILYFYYRYRRMKYE